MDPNTKRSLRSRIRMDLLPYCEGRSMISVDLSAAVRVGSMIRMDSGSRWTTSRFHPDASEVTVTCCCCGRRGRLVSAEGMVSAAAAAAARDAARPPPLLHRAGTLPGLHRLSAA